MKRNLIFCLMLMIQCVAWAGPLDETRCCVTEIKRAADGSILRRSDVLTAFQKLHPCPSTGKTSGACPGWAKNHTIPLACFGKDEVSNLQWLPNDVKSGAGPHMIDRFERKIYCNPTEIVK